MGMVDAVGWNHVCVRARIENKIVTHFWVRIVRLNNITKLTMGVIAWQ